MKFCKISSSRGGGFNPKPLPLRTPLLNINYHRFQLGYRRKLQSTLRHSSHKCKNIKLRVKTGEENTHHCVSAIYSCKIRLPWCLVEYEQSSTESVWLDRPAHTPVLAKLLTNWECAWSTQENFQFFIMLIVQQTFSFRFSLLRHYQILECFHEKSSFWTRATVLSCYRNCWCSHCGQRLRWSAIADKIKWIIAEHNLKHA